VDSIRRQKTIVRMLRSGDSLFESRLAKICNFKTEKCRFPQNVRKKDGVHTYINKHKPENEKKVLLKFTFDVWIIKCKCYGSIIVCFC